MAGLIDVALLGDDRHAMGAARADHLRLIEDGMHLDLITDQRLQQNRIAFSISATVKFDTPT